MLSDRERMITAIMDCACYVILADAKDDVTGWLNDFRMSNCSKISQTEMLKMMDDVYNEIQANSRIVKWAAMQPFKKAIEP